MHLWLGAYQLAADEYGDALDLAAGIGDLSARPLLLAELGWVALLRGDVAVAAQLAGEAVGFAEEFVNRRVLAHALRLHGEALLRRGRPDDAVAALDRALTVAEQFGAPAEIAGVLCSQAVGRPGTTASGRRPAPGRAVARAVGAPPPDAAGRPRLGPRHGGPHRGRPRRRGRRLRGDPVLRRAHRRPALHRQRHRRAGPRRRRAGQDPGGRRRSGHARCACGTGWATGWASRSPWWRSPPRCCRPSRRTPPG